MKYNLVIVSAGKFGREVYSWAGDCVDAGQAFAIKGFLDNRPNPFEGRQYDAPILGSVETYSPAALDRFLIAVGDPSQKRRHALALERKGAAFANLIHPKAVLGRNVKYGHGLIIGPYSVVTCDVSIGNFVTLYPFCMLAHDTVVEDFCQVSSHCSVNGNASLREGAFLGAGAVVAPNASVGDWAYVGAGSVVLKRVDRRDKVFGNPAAIIGSVENMTPD
jgi:sugar O-acyltransferase (sialic acid O-acetyltransferase NeuD family)